MLDFRRDFSPLWSAYTPTRIVFGVGSLTELGKVCSVYGKSALLVTGDSALRTGLAERCFGLLGEYRIHTNRCYSIASEPNVHQVNEIAEIARGEKVDMLVAVGGGSAMDAAKAASVVATQGGTAEEYLSGERPVTMGSVSVIAVPTTAGTGAELSKAAILSWPEQLFKGGMRGDALFPKAAVVDPSLTLTLPPHQTSITGFDAFAHAVETYVSRCANPMSAILSCDAVKAICRCLPHVLKYPQDILARTYLSFYSMVMGWNLANCSTCLPHRLQYPLGALTNTPHGLGLAALYPTWIKTTYHASSKRFDDVAGWMIEEIDIQKEEMGPDIFNCLSHFMHKINLSPSLRELGVDEQMCSRLSRMVSGELRNDPWWQEGTDLSTIYRSALDHPESSRQNHESGYSCSR